MATQATKTRGRWASVPDGWHTVTPRLLAHDSGKLVAFLKKVFGATGTYRGDRPAELKIGDSNVMVSDASARRPMTGCLYVYVVDTDATYQRALAAGATSIEAPGDLPYGDRRCMIEDAWGNSWQIATRLPTPSSRGKR